MEEELQPFFARRRSSEGQIVVEFGGDCDASAQEAVNELSVVVAERPRRVVVDLALATLVDSLTLGSLIAAAKRVRADG